MANPRLFRDPLDRFMDSGSQPQESDEIAELFRILDDPRLAEQEPDLLDAPQASTWDRILGGFADLPQQQLRGRRGSGEKFAFAALQGLLRGLGQSRISGMERKTGEVQKENVRREKEARATNIKRGEVRRAVIQRSIEKAREAAKPEKEPDKTKVTVTPEIAKAHRMDPATVGSEVPATSLKFPEPKAPKEKKEAKWDLYDEVDTRRISELRSNVEKAQKEIDKFGEGIEGRQAAADSTTRKGKGERATTARRKMGALQDAKVKAATDLFTYDKQRVLSKIRALPKDPEAKAQALEMVIKDVQASDTLKRDNAILTALEKARQEVISGK